MLVLPRHRGFELFFKFIVLRLAIKYIRDDPVSFAKFTLDFDKTAKSGMARGHLFIALSFREFALL